MKILIIFLIYLWVAQSEDIDYYWRDFSGEIPDDAVPGGKDADGKTTYIAQVYIAKNGILPTRLYQNQKNVTTSRYGIHTSQDFIKILCGNNLDRFSWIPTTNTKYHLDLIGKTPVIGGTENGKLLSIGRIAYQNEEIVGKVCGYNIGNALMYFPYGQKEISVDSYEVLVYDTAEFFIVPKFL